jgi:DUF4097 and DUF4098 domain-containing protein YvlB
MRSKLALFALILSAGLSVTACDIQAGEGGFSFGVAAGKAQETWTRSYKLAPGSRLELINTNGKISAEPAEGDSVEVSGVRTAKASSDDAAKELLGKVEMREEVSGSSVRIEVRTPRFSGMSGHSVEWTIKVPKGVNVDLRTVNGGVRLQGLQGDIAARTTNGGVSGKGIISQNVQATAVNGGIEIEFGAPLAADGKVEFETVNGGVEIGLPSESKATIAARCVNGGVQFLEGLDVKRNNENVSGREAKRRLDGTLNGGGARVSLTTVNGGVTLRKVGSTTS